MENMIRKELMEFGIKVMQLQESQYLTFRHLANRCKYLQLAKLGRPPICTEPSRQEETFTVYCVIDECPIVREGRFESAMKRREK